MSPTLLRTATGDRPGVRTFYVPSESSSPKEYVVQYIRRRRARRFHCFCPDFMFRGFPTGRLCKHARLVRAVIQAAGGISHVPRAAMLVNGSRREWVTRG